MGGGFPSGRKRRRSRRRKTEGPHVVMDGMPGASLEGTVVLTNKCPLPPPLSLRFRCGPGRTELRFADARICLVLYPIPISSVRCRGRGGAAAAAFLSRVFFLFLICFVFFPFWSGLMCCLFFPAAILVHTNRRGPLRLAAGEAVYFVWFTNQAVSFALPFWGFISGCSFRSPLPSGPGGPSSPVGSRRIRTDGNHGTANTAASRRGLVGVPGRRECGRGDVWGRGASECLFGPNQGFGAVLLQMRASTGSPDGIRVAYPDGVPGDGGTWQSNNATIARGR
ncbi:hypothetical protein LX36DRAFT_340708 [Colletotrichum falcatum]|nr:hypothetical protein LX36DRAFT_340708 [Colletotrichum falcatum]